MAHICPWDDRKVLESDGSCSHCALNEGLCGNFDLTAEELEIDAVEREQKRY